MKSFSFFFYIIVILFSTKVFSQSVSINTDGSQPHPSAILDVKSNSKGILLPRTSTTSRTAIVNPPKGLILYDTTTSGFWFHNGSVWTQLSAGSIGWNLTGNAGTDSAKNFIGTTDYKPLVFRTNNIEQMHLSTSGKLGVGTKNPAAKLHVDGGDYVSLSSPGYLQLGTTASYNMAMDYNVIQSRNNGSANDLFLNYYGGNIYIGQSGLFGVHVAPNGTVGINGTSNSGYTLNVNASAALNGINVTDPVNNYILYSNKSGPGIGLYVAKTSASSDFGATIYSLNNGNGAGIDAKTNYGAGVSGHSTNGIGVFANSDNYHGLYAVNNNSNYYAGYFNGNIYTSGVYGTSDQKLKENIKDFSSATAIINQLHPRQYDYRHDGNYKLMNLPQGNHYGLIAQDVEKILPGLVKNSKFDLEDARLSKPGDTKNPLGQNGIKKAEIIDFKALNYTELIPIMIKGMQEQQTIIEELKKQMTEMKIEMDLLKKKN